MEALKLYPAVEALPVLPRPSFLLNQYPLPLSTQHFMPNFVLPPVNNNNNNNNPGNSPASSNNGNSVQPDELEILEREACSLLMSLACRPFILNNNFHQMNNNGLNNQHHLAGLSFKAAQTSFKASSPPSPNHLQPLLKIKKQKRKNYDAAKKAFKLDALADPKNAGALPLATSLAIKDPIGQKVIVKDFLTEGELLSVCPFTIKCSCCNNVFTPSNFEKHVGSTAHRPYECILLVGVSGRDGSPATLRNLKNHLEVGQ